MRLRALLLVGLVSFLAAPPAWAVKEWYDYYLEARDKEIPAGRCKEAIADLQAALKLKPGSAVNEQTYGLQFVDYFPYYWQGVCHLKLGDFNTAQRMFNIEESQAQGNSPIKRTAQYKDLVRLRTQAQDAENQRVARLAREEVQRLQRDADELFRARKYDDALARLAEAQKAAAALEPQIQRTIAETRDRIRAEQTTQSEAAAQKRRIDQALAEGERLVQEGKDTDAGVRFDEVLALDPHNARAAEGRRAVQDRILASQTRATLEAAFQEGRAQFEAQRYEDALKPLTLAAADPANVRAKELLEQARGTLERLRQQKDIHQRVERLSQEADALLAARHYPEAQVRLEDLLQLDPQNMKAAERRAFAERMTGESILSRWLPNQPPALTFFEPRTPDSDLVATTASVVGIASDDRGVAKVEFRVGDQVVAQQVPAPQAQVSDQNRNVLFEREFPLQPGVNQLTVTATDLSGLQKTETFRINRRLRFWQEAWFLPSASLGAVAIVGLGLGAQRWRRRRAVRRRFNPYIAGAPVMDDSMFYGRAKLLTRILNVLHHNSLMITGERRIGKTTFLFHLRRALAADEGGDYRFFPVSTDLQGVPEEGFFHTVMGDVVEQLQLAPETLQALRFRGDSDRYDGRDFSHDLQRVIEELKTRTERRVKLALLIDEVDVLNEYSERINQRLRSIFMKTFSEHLVAIMSGVGIKRLWNSEGSPWYNFFDEIELTPFSREEAEALVREPVEGYFRYDAEAVERILSYSSLKPYVIQKFCIHAVNQMLEQGRSTITDRDVEAVRESVLSEGREPERRAGADRRAV